ncbi:MAG: DUF3053 family protein [Phycisphaerae bacterium]|nr:DUF3053 family protein [Phycisphaerae bacterium]
MKMKVTCPSCKKTLGMPEEYSGKLVECPSCGEAVPVPIPIPSQPTNSDSKPSPQIPRPEHNPTTNSTSDTPWIFRLVLIASVGMIIPLLFAGGKSTDLAYSVGYWLPFVLGIFYFSKLRKRGWRIASISFVVICGATLTGVLLSSARNHRDNQMTQNDIEQAGIALDEIKESLLDLAEKSTDSEGFPQLIEGEIDTTPKAKGEFGEMERFIKEFMAKAAKQGNDYQLELTNIGINRLLEAKRIEKDETFAESKVILRKAKQIVEKYGTRTDELIAEARNKISTLNVSRAAKKGMEKGFDEALASSLEQLKTMWDLEEKILGEMVSIINFLEERKGTWTVQDDQIVFARETDVARYNAFLLSIHRIAKEQQEIKRRQIKKALAKFDSAKTKLRGGHKINLVLPSLPNLQDVYVLPLTTIPNESDKSKRQQNRWPSCFLDTHKTRKIASDPFVPKLTPALIKEMSQAWVFFMTQEKIIRSVGEKFPDLHDRLSIAQFQFQQKYRPAIENIDRIVGKQFAQWEKVKKASIEEIEPLIRNQLENIERATAEVILDKLENQYKGKISSPIIETLLMFHPTYMKYPVQEIIDGFKKEYRSDGSGKAMGIKIGLEYPASWQEKEGRRPHIVKKIISKNGKGRVSAMIMVTPIPEEFAEFESKDVILQILNDKEVLQEVFPSGGKVIDYGLASHAKVPLLWIEGTVKRNRVGTDIEMHQLIFIFIRKNKMAWLTFTCAGTPDKSSETVLQEFHRHAPLFKSMLNSVDFFGRYDSPNAEVAGITKKLNRSTKEKAK